MYQLTTQEAITAVRKNLDELDPNGSVMYTDENGDNASVSDVIARSIPEAINSVHLFAPVTMLEEEAYAGAYDSLKVSDKVLHFKFTAPYLRLVAFQAADSPVVVTVEIPEGTAEGRKQLNPYVRGRYDRPRLVRIQGTRSAPEFAYYSLRDDTYNSSPAKAIKRFSFVKELFYSADAESYPVSAGLRQSAIDQLTAITLAIYGETNKAQYFADKARNI